jgi:hypothetical protein
MALIMQCESGFYPRDISLNPTAALRSTASMISSHQTNFVFFLFFITTHTK